MAKLAKFLQGVAGAGAAAGLNVEEVFSTYLYEGNSSTQTITNGIDLAGEGGLVWIKDRTSASNQHSLNDTERGATKYLKSNSSDAEGIGDLTSFNSNGFSVRYQQTGYINENGMDLASWTFRKAPKFFDVVTYTGNGTNQYIDHNLNGEVGAIFVKRTDTTSNWAVYHKGQNATAPEDYYMILNLTDEASNNNGFWLDTAPTTTNFRVGNDSTVNASGGTYVAYLFAHNDGDGDFGPTGDQDVIRCGSFTEVNGSDVTVDLGFEPQWIMIKTSSTTGGWGMYDVMRGWNSGGTDYALTANTSDAEASVGDRWLINPNGFTWKNTNNARDIIYIAIRRGPMAVPESATDVFDVTLNPTSPNVPSDTLVDSLFFKSTGSAQSWWVADRLRQGAGNLQTDTTAAEASNTYLDFRFDQMTGTRTVANSFGSNYVGYTWKRAPNYFDVVAYTGNGVAGRTVSHNLGVVPEMIWFKSRSNAQNWYVYHKDNTYISGALSTYLRLNTTDASLNSSYFMSSISSSDFGLTIGTPNDSGKTYIAYLFASLDGVSKVGSFSHTNGGGDTNVDCGFSSGARFVLYKQYDSSGSWYVLDSTRGIVAGNDPALLLNSNAAQDSSYDQIDPYSSGFTIPSDGVGTGDYIFYAIA